MFDITKQRAEDTAAVHLKGIDGELLYADAQREKPVQIRIYGPGSKPFATVEDRQTNRALKRLNDNDNKVSTVSGDQRREEQAEDLADITVAFENFDYPAPKGESFAAPADMFRAFYADPKLGHLVKQVIKACGDWGNFKPGSKAS